MSLNIHLIYACQFNTKKKIKRWWNGLMNDIAYCNLKFNHFYKVVDRLIGFTKRSTGL